MTALFQLSTFTSPYFLNLQLSFCTSKQLPAALDRRALYLLQQDQSTTNKLVVLNGLDTTFQNPDKKIRDKAAETWANGVHRLSDFDQTRVVHRMTSKAFQECGFLQHGQAMAIGKLLAYTPQMYTTYIDEVGNQLKEKAVNYTAGNEQNLADFVSNGLLILPTIAKHAKMPEIHTNGLHVSKEIGKDEQARLAIISYYDGFHNQFFIAANNGFCGSLYDDQLTPEDFFDGGLAEDPDKRFFKMGIFKPTLKKFLENSFTGTTHHYLKKFPLYTGMRNV
jgi:hypothetical protein